MRWIFSAIIVSAVAFTGCVQVPAAPPVPPTTMTSWGPMGGFTMSSGATCAGRATLNGGSATVSDPCFTGTDNIVMCTDITAPNAIRCTPSSGSLSIAGAPDDTISYARVR
jgi:hypothetical protein